MIAPPSNTQIWIAAGATDLRRGFTGLNASVQTKLEQTPFGARICVSRPARRFDQVALVRGRRALSIRGGTVGLLSFLESRVFNVIRG